MRTNIDRRTTTRAMRGFPMVTLWSGLLLPAPAVIGCSGGGKASTTAPPERLSSQASADTSKRSAPRAYEAASVLALPGANCELRPEGSTDATQTVPVFVDDDGIGRFYAVRPQAAGDVQSLTLACVDESGVVASYTISLTSADTFQPRRFDFAHATGVLRPELTGDPRSYDVMDLARAGYGIRPDPSAAPVAYARWLKAATRPVRNLRARNWETKTRFMAASPTPSVTNGTSTQWGGAILYGAPPYPFAYEEIEVGVAIPGGVGTTNAGAAVWGGLGGDNNIANNAGLIQSGSAAYTTTTTASYFAWREYCCGEGGANFNGVQNLVPINFGDTVYSQQWARDSAGKDKVNLGYWCYYLVDDATVAGANCTSPKDPHCPSLPATSNFPFTGNSAEFIYEATGGAAPDQFCCTLITGEAQSQSQDAYMDFMNDSVDLWTLVAPNGRAIETPKIIAADEVQFTFDLE